MQRKANTSTPAISCMPSAIHFAQSRSILRTLAVSGSAVPVVEQLMMFGTGAAEFSVSRQGSLVMMNGTPDSYAEPRTLVWLDRQGREEPIQAPTRAYHGAQDLLRTACAPPSTFATATATSGSGISGGRR